MCSKDATLLRACALKIKITPKAELVPDEPLPINIEQSL